MYIESPFHLLSFFTRAEEARRMWKRWRSGPVEVEERLWVHTFCNLLPYRRNRFGFDSQINALNQALILPQLKGNLNRLGFINPILFIGAALALPLLKHLPHCLQVYHCSDDFTCVDTFPKSFRALEAQVIRQADVVIATAEELRKAKAPLNNRIFTVTNGAHVDHFAKTQLPETAVAQDIAPFKKPVIALIGTVFRWIDQEMVAYAAQRHPDWSFVFIGQVTTDISVLKSCPNIHIFGPRPYADLPGYLKGIDVVTVPFLFNDLTLRASPIKFYEYLASGVPIVASRLPDFEPFAHLAHLVRTKEEFSVALEAAVADKSPEKRSARMAEGQKHSWEARFRRIDELIESALAEKEPGKKT
jgi:glycosyltransferase involved in cell wall biosynthesis